MGKLRKFIRLPPDERTLLVRAVWYLVAVRLGLAFVPFRSVEHGTLRLVNSAAGANGDSVSRERLAWAAQTASRSVPGAECLARAIVLQALLRRYGYSARLCMDFAKDGSNEFAGHAWIESQGQAYLNYGRTGR